MGGVGISFPLSIRPLPAGAPRAKAAAWFIPGKSAETWSIELAGWGVPTSGLRLYVVPTSLRDRTPCGAMVIGSDAVAADARHRALPYACRADRLYFPADARLDPPVSDEELRSVLRLNVQVLHPSVGLVGFADEDALHVADLLAAPSRREGDWDRAVAGPAPPPRLVWVEPDAPPPTLEDIIDEGRDDIGSEAPDELPPAPDESAAKNMVRRAARPGLKLISWLASRAPGGAGRTSASGGVGGTSGGGSQWLNQLQDWAGRKLGSINAALAAARFKELHRLRELMKSDPDEGLRYAIPLSGGQSRGKAPPGGRLGPRDVNFNLARLGGGRPGDVWEVPWEIQQELIARYRAAANRELNLGRYRRAAYVFAELLGDFDAAASALRQGRHFRDAATLYRERLRNPVAAAGCLEHGGLLAEAVAEYEGLKMFEKAAGLYERLDRADEAARCYRAAVDAAKRRGETVKAAGLLETKLAAPDEALALLDEAWPASDAAGTCLGEWFSLLGRLGRHEQAARRAARLRDDDRPADDRVLPAAQVLGAVAAAYPDPNARAVAADAARVLAGVRLPVAGQRDAQSLLDVVTHLAPHDRLLARDASRYAARRRARPSFPPPAPAAPAAKSGKGVAAVHQFRLPEYVAWKQVVSDGGGFYAYGEVPSGLFIVRGRWDGVVQGIYVKPEPGASDYLLSTLPGRPGVLLLPLNVRPTPAVSFFHRSDAFPESVEVGAPAWAPQGPSLGGCVDEAGVAWLLSLSGDLTLSAYRADGAVVSTRSLEWRRSTSIPFFMAARNRHVFIASLTSMLRVAPRGETRWETLSGVVRRMAVSTPFTRVRVALAFDEGGAVCWDDGDSRPFGEGLVEPVVAFTRGGALVAISKGVGRAYRTDEKGIAHHATFTAPDNPPLTVVPVDKLHHFATFGADGVVRVFQLTG